ncbi:hypothetical protein L1887_20377 [Cichorium endivia]|nr:hypothetical protein L1887_20377 [Cichorium endivia]
MSPFFSGPVFALMHSLTSLLFSSILPEKKIDKIGIINGRFVDEILLPLFSPRQSVTANKTLPPLFRAQSIFFSIQAISS